MLTNWRVVDRIESAQGKQKLTEALKADTN